jgi:type I restriction enzyme, S subunit
VLGDFVQLQRGTTYKSSLLGLPGPVLLGLASIRPNGGFRRDSLRTYGGDSPEKLLLNPGDLYVSLKDVTQSADLLGAVSRVPSFVRIGRLTQDTVKLVFKNNQLSASYVFWLLRTPEYRNYCRKRATGTTNLGLAREDFLSFLVPEPTAVRAMLIALLDQLETKIELNWRMNETLEAMAGAIFKSWFVDFDPVCAKARGLQPLGMDAETAAVFPDSFEDSALGTIPKGWRVDEIRRRTSDIQYGLTRSATTEKVGPHFLRITDIQGGRIDWGEVPYCPVSGDEHDKYRIRPGDIFVARTGASTGENVYIVDSPDSVFASYLVRFQFDDKSLARVVGEYMRTPGYFDFVANAIGGSAQPNASAQLLASTGFAFPPNAVAQRFAELVRPLDQRRICNNAESQTLAAIRDTLLSKLISGEIRLLANELHLGKN